MHTYLDIILNKEGTVSAVRKCGCLLLTMVLTLLEVFTLGHYGPSSTGRIQQLAYNTKPKQGVTKLSKLLNW